MSRTPQHNSINPGTLASYLSQGLQPPARGSTGGNINPKDLLRDDTEECPTMYGGRPVEVDEDRPTDVGGDDPSELDPDHEGSLDPPSTPLADEWQDTEWTVMANPIYGDDGKTVIGYQTDIETSFFRLEPIDLETPPVHTRPPQAVPMPGPQPSPVRVPARSSSPPPSWRGLTRRDLLVVIGIVLIAFGFGALLGLLMLGLI